MSNELSLYDDAWIAEVYDFAYAPEGDRDTVFWLALAEDSGGSVLELACGTGRVLLPLAREGYETTGLDISPRMLAVADRKLEQEEARVGARVRLVKADMRNFALGEQFGLILVPYRSFQALLERADQRSCLRCCASHLKPGGLLAIDVFSPKLSLLSTPGTVRFEDEHKGPDGAVIREMSSAQYDLANQRLVWRPRYQCTAAEGAVTVHQCVLPLRYFFRFEMEWMLEACGFEIEALYGDFDRSPFTADSPEIIFVARRAR